MIEPFHGVVQNRLPFCARLRAITAFSIVAAGAVGGSTLADEDRSVQPWALSLAAQLKSEKRCDLQTSYFVRELPSAEGGTLYSGRIKCHDGREFDFSQTKPHLKFELTACEPTTC